MSVLRSKGPATLFRKKSKRGFRGYPAAVIAFYGPTATLATKVVVGIARDRNRQIDPLRKWFSENDLRHDEKIGLETAAFLKEQGVSSVVMTELSAVRTKKVSTIPTENLAPSVPSGWAVIASPTSVSIDYNRV